MVNKTAEAVANFINGREVEPKAAKYFNKINPANGQVIARVVRSQAADIETAVIAAQAAQKDWARMPAVKRGELLYAIANLMVERRDELAATVALETGKSTKDALGETDGSIALARFYAGEGQRLYGRTTTSGVVNKAAMTVREPVGVAGLIIAANTPIANIAWKVFPALICGNAAILKCSEDAPLTARLFGRICDQAKLPAGLLAIIHGLGQEAGAPLVAHPGVGVISFTGSTAVGRVIAEVAGRRLAKVSLELGGKNPLVVCDDADIDNAVKWAVLSAFSNAGQRCAAGSRIIVTAGVYQQFKQKFVAATKALKVGPGDQDDLGPVINERQLTNMLKGIKQAVKDGAKIVTGGERLTDAAHRDGFYLAPTIIEGADPDDFISQHELFGPITCLYKVKNFPAALALANRSAYGLTAAVHTSNVNTAAIFTREIEAGVAVVNAGTFGSEPHMPFGGVKQSGNGSREPGSEAIDIYSNLKDVYSIIID